MRSTYRSFLAAILLTAAAAVSLSQEPSTAPPPQAPPAVKPATELPAIPLAKPETLPVQPALTGDPSAVKVEPVPLEVAVPPAMLKTVTTTTKHVVKKTGRKPAAKPAVEVTESLKSAAPAASVVAVEPPASTPPADTAAIAAHPAIAAPVAPAQPAPALKPAGDPTGSEVTKSTTTMGLGGWVLFGIGVVLLFGAITWVRRRRTNARHRSITDFSPRTGDVELQPALARRP